jgi:hypothetical protein
MNSLLCALALISACIVNTNDHYFFKYGLGLNEGSFPDTTTKILSVGEVSPLSNIFDYQLEVGVFSDNNQTQGLIGFISPSLGLQTKGSGLYVSYFLGPALLTSTDTRLGSVFEFNNDFEAGIRDDRGVSIGVDYKHFSNAGLTSNNIGRDFFTIKLSIPLK